MPKLASFSCPRHQVDEDDERWSQALMIVSDQMSEEQTPKTFSPCPWCLDELLNDVREAHGMLDSVGIPRRARGKTVLSLHERMKLLFELEGKISELRTS